MSLIFSLLLSRLEKRHIVVENSTEGDSRSLNAFQREQQYRVGRVIAMLDTWLSTAVVRIKGRGMFESETPVISSQSDIGDAYDS